MDEINNLPEQNRLIFRVTGASRGLGDKNSSTLSKKETKVIVACRSLGKIGAAKDNTKEEVPKADVAIMQIELSGLDSVRNFANMY